MNNLSVEMMQENIERMEQELEQMKVLLAKEKSKKEWFLTPDRKEIKGALFNKTLAFSSNTSSWEKAKKENKRNLFIISIDNHDRKERVFTSLTIEGMKELRDYLNKTINYVEGE